MSLLLPEANIAKWIVHWIVRATFLLVHRSPISRATRTVAHITSKNPLRKNVSHTRKCTWLLSMSCQKKSQRLLKNVLFPVNNTTPQVHLPNAIKTTCAHIWKNSTIWKVCLGPYEVQTHMKMSQFYFSGKLRWNFNEVCKEDQRKLLLTVSATRKNI